MTCGGHQKRLPMFYLMVLLKSPVTPAAGLPQSSVDVVLSGLLPPPAFSHSASDLAELARILRPSGTLLLREPVSTPGQWVM